MTTDVSSTSTVSEITPNGAYKFVVINTPATADTGDTITLTLLDYGISQFFGIYGAVQTTVNSIVVAEQPTTSVSAGDLTITLGGSGQNNKVRSYLIWGI